MVGLTQQPTQATDKGGSADHALQPKASWSAPDAQLARALPGNGSGTYAWFQGTSPHCTHVPKNARTQIKVLTLPT